MKTRFARLYNTAVEQTWPKFRKLMNDNQGVLTVGLTLFSAGYAGYASLIQTAKEGDAEVKASLAKVENDVKAEIRDLKTVLDPHIKRVSVIQERYDEDRYAKAIVDYLQKNPDQLAEKLKLVKSKEKDSTQKNL